MYMYINQAFNRGSISTETNNPVDVVRSPLFITDLN